MDEKETILEAKQVYKIYRGRPVIRNATLRLHEGECVMVTGSSGCGKTTLLRLLSGTTRATLGNVWSRPRLSEQFMPANAAKDIRLSTFRFLVNMAMLDGYSRGEAERVCKALIAHYDLSGMEKAAIRELSDSMFRKVMIAQAMLKPCDLLFLDEPFIGLDQNMRNLLFEDMIRIKQQNTAILIACPPDDGVRGKEALVDRVWHIEHGVVKEAGQ
ncbi:MAG: ATP-binding cassette domain-containing protein [Clostridium sp.]|nr:ATP-binding cassette domain-containing protein [Clostridium sp.]